MKGVFNLLTSPLGLPINPLWEYIILAVVEVIAHKAAWEISPGGEMGSFIYWSFKFVITVTVWAILYGVIVAAKFVVAHWLWFALGAAAALIGFGTWLLLRNRRSPMPPQ